MDKSLSRTVLRILLGLLVLLPGISKVMDISGISGLLSSTLGLGALSVTVAWIVAFIEILGGAALILGFKTDIAVWPVFLVLLVATIAVVLPNTSFAPTNLLFHLIALAGLLVVYAEGPGKYALK